MKYFHKINTKKLDYLILLIMGILICAGLFCIYHIDLVSIEKDHLFYKQLLGCFLGTILIIIILFFDYGFICRLSPLLYLGILGVLALTLKLGKNLNNVTRWISIAGISFQPSELAKVILILFLAYLSNLFFPNRKKFYPFFLLAFATCIPIGLILLEPHLSPCIVLILLFCVIVLVSGIRYKVLLTILLVTAPLVTSVFLGVHFFHWNLPFIKDYQITRVLNFLSTDEKEDSDGKFQQNQSVVAIQSGGSYGKAFQPAQVRRNYYDIYANESDFIFSAIGEEFGFVGCFLLMTLFFLLVIRCLLIAAHAPDLTGKIICTAISALFMFQAFINIGVATKLIPTTGMPFPFISYGLTSLLSDMIAVGLVLDVDMQSKNGVDLHV